LLTSAAEAGAVSDVDEDEDGQANTATGEQQGGNRD